MSFSFSTRSLKRMNDVDAAIKVVAHRAIQITKIDFGIPEHGGKRTEEEQGILFLTGVSKADGIEKKSNHQDGNALDFYAIDPDTGKASWDQHLMTHVAAAFLQAASELGIRIEWGGFWRSFVDMPHIQLKDTL